MGIKVLHLIDSGGLYGAEKMLLSLVQEQIKQGLEPMILSVGSPDVDEKAIEREARILELPLKVWRMKPGLNFAETGEILNWAGSVGFNLFHSHGYKFNILLAIFSRTRKKLPLFTTVHGYVKAKRFSKMWLYEHFDRFALRNMRGVALVDNTMLREIPSLLRKSTRVRVIPNGLDVESLEKRALEPLEFSITEFLNNHEPVLLGVGRLSREKGFDRLLPAFAELKKTFPFAGLLIVGEGKMRECIEDICRDLGLENDVLMPGYYPNVAALLGRVDLLVMPSHTEGLPISILEAMAVRTPIVATAVGAIPSLLGEGLGGELIDEVTSLTLARGILKALKNTELAKERVDWSYRTVKENYSSGTMAVNYRNFYESGLQ